ncbi:hypothetical protein QLL95_gp0940 [Cotonvirus japonicus]|uniref:Permuted papain-like amidase YaeF/Yiix C92 family enzyme n=1 Tax=Cotonvirus japonicus TaxID=2811091 RepID=A0ABM7NSQ9_9VIRU|nr:hypothetical protein QLL95_gp0940 [Cotonvirus japonicus]BCS83183.1 hypothetical protein [Cotonvirus japonicus]
MILKIVIIVIIIIILLLILTYVVNEKKQNDSTMYKFDEIKPYLKTGDIILFSCSQHFSPVEKLKYISRTSLVGCKYGHVGLVLKRNNKLYVAECTDYDHPGYKYATHFNDKNKGGVRIIEMEKLLKDYTQEYKATYAVKFISQEIPNELFYKKISKHFHKTFEYKPILLTLAFFDIMISHDVGTKLSEKMYNKNKLMCSEFAHSVLYDCGALKYYPSKIFWPHVFEEKTFLELEKIPFSKTYNFAFDN